MCILQYLRHNICIICPSSLQHLLRFPCQTIDISKGLFLLQHIGKLIHQFPVRNRNIAILTTQKAINHHCRKNFITSRKVHRRSRIFTNLCRNRYSWNHQRQIITHRIYIMLNIIEYLIIRSGTGPIIAQIIINKRKCYRPRIVYSFTWTRMISVIPLSQSLTCHFLILGQCLILGKYLINFRFCKTEIFAVFLFRYHSVLTEHVQFWATWVFCDRKNSCHISKLYVRLIL